MLAGDEPDYSSLEHSDVTDAVQPPAAKRLKLTTADSSMQLVMPEQSDPLSASDTVSCNLRSAICVYMYFQIFLSKRVLRRINVSALST